MNHKIILGLIITLIILIFLSPSTFADIGITDEYMNVTKGETFNVYADITDLYQWILKDYDENYLDTTGLLSGFSCVGEPPANVTCTYVFPFKAIKEGQTTIELNKINISDNSTVEIKYIYVTIVSAATCTDSDGGKNYYEIGTVTYSNNPGQPPGVSAKNTEYCLNEITLVEHYCENGLFKSIEYQCPNGCENGACLLKGKPDLKVEKIDYSLDNPTSPTKLHFQVTIKNIGNTESSFFEVNVQIPQLSMYVENTCMNHDLLPGESCVEMGYGYNGLGGTISEGYYDIKAFVDPRNLVDELNEDNNQAHRQDF